MLFIGIKFRYNTFLGNKLRVTVIYNDQLYFILPIFCCIIQIPNCRIEDLFIFKLFIFFISGILRP